MSAAAAAVRAVTCYVVGCGRCGQVYEYDDVEAHFPSVDEAIAQVLGACWGHLSADGPLLCPSCTCADLGHVDGPVIALRCLYLSRGHPVGCRCSTDAGVGLVGCRRCDRVERIGPGGPGGENGAGR